MSLELQDVKKSFQINKDKIEVLKNINLKIESGQRVAIIGQSGSGKSTLLSLLAGLDKPEFGNIFIEKTNIVKLNKDEVTKFRGKNIGVIFQNFNLISYMTALENVMLPIEILNETDAKKKAQDLLSRVGLSDRQNHLPSQLSGGECQRVAMARSLATLPSLILADEPSGNLDEKTSDSVMSLFFEVTSDKNITTILVTHNLELAKRCDRIYSLKNGELFG